MNRFLAIVMMLLGLISMTAVGVGAEEEPGFAAPIEEAHGLEAWRSHGAVHGHLMVKWGEQTVINGHVLFDTPLGKVRMEQKDGPVLVFDGQEAWVSPSDVKFPMARFHLLTWPYFIAAPMKLTDPGTQLQVTEDMPLDDRVMATARLTFDDDIGDSPDDWYILFRDKQTNRLEGMAYIVTYGGVDPTEAEKMVHAVRYEEFETVDGVVIPTKFSIYDWNAEAGIHGEALGQVEFSHVQFVEPGDDAFNKPEDASLAPLPTAKE